MLALAAEAVFLAGRTWLLHNSVPGVAQEIAWTLWRLPFIGLYFWLMAGLLPEPVYGAPELRHPLIAVSLALLLPDAFNQDDRSLAYGVTLALTSPIVGIREELFYRGIVQGFFERIIPPWAAIAAATVMFTTYHWGAQPWNPVSITGIASASVVLGVIYHRTRSLWLVAGIHAILDVAYSLGPSVGVTPVLLVGCHVAAVVFALAWWRGEVHPLVRGSDPHQAKPGSDPLTPR